MTNSIFEQVERDLRSFYPRSPLEYFALRLAQKLGEAVSARHYLSLVERQSKEALIAAYRRAAKSVDSSMTLPRRFHAELQHGTQGELWGTRK